MKQIFILLLINIILLEYNNAIDYESICNLQIPTNEDGCYNITIVNETNPQITKKINDIDPKFKCCYENFRLIKINDKKTCRWIEKDEYKEEKKRLKKYGAKAVKVDCKSGFYFLNNFVLILIIFLFF
jgi:hypothetical protein